MRKDSERSLEAVAERISRDILEKWAPEVDRCNRFPQESVEALREAGLIGFFVPTEMGGAGGSFRGFSAIAAALGEGCLSTALIWAMHSQQVAVLARHLAHRRSDVLDEIVRHGKLVASVTSEYGKGGELLTAEAFLEPAAGGFRLRRRAPSVSYGEQADLFLVTMRATEDSPPADVRLVLARADDGEVRTTGGWDAMGMRGTRSVPMEFDLLLDEERIVGSAFRRVALETMVPAGHIGWAAAWYGAARGVVRRFVGGLRSRRERGRRSGGEMLSFRLAEIRASLDLIEALLYRVAAGLDGMRQQDVPAEAYEDWAYNIRLNNLKISASRLAFSISDQLIELAGLARGYLQTDSIGLERVFRDLRSASLMYHNDRLLTSNGKLILLEGVAPGAFWKQAPERARGAL